MSLGGVDEERSSETSSVDGKTLTRHLVCDPTILAGGVGDGVQQE